MKPSECEAKGVGAEADESAAEPQGRTTADRRLTIADCRSEVIAFAIEMERKLRQHDGTKGEDAWKGDDPYDLANRTQVEARELLDACWELETTRPTRAAYDAVMGEAADVGNMAMMAADAAGALPWVARIADAEWARDHVVVSAQVRVAGVIEEGGETYRRGVLLECDTDDDVRAMFQLYAAGKLRIVATKEAG